ncbi:MAG: hypothetical protein ACPGYV_11650 [Phycisphaeraceae bacterium]
MTEASIENLKRTVYRHVYAGWLKGRRINAVSIEAEMCFLRINLACDGHGNFHADPELVAIEAFPLRRSVTPEQCSQWIDELAQCGLVSLYEAGGETYGHITGFAGIQPAGKNGRRHRLHPEPPPPQADPRESKGIQIDPVNPNEQNENENENEKEKKNENENEKARSAQADGCAGSMPVADSVSFSLPTSDSGSAKAASAKATQPLTREKAKARWVSLIVQQRMIGRVNGSTHPKGSPQHEADLTSINRLWDRVWPEAIDDGDADQVGRFNTLVTITKHAKGKNKPMAWMTQHIKKQIAEVPE